MSFVRRSIDENGEFFVFACGDGTLFSVDAEDQPLVSRHRWFVSKGPSKYGRYIARSKNDKTQILSREIMGCPKGLTVDHINTLTHNNCRYNMRICTGAENRINKHNFKRSSTGFRGVYLMASGRYSTMIGKNHKYWTLGTFDTAEEAARVWDAEAVRIRGKYAVLNFPLPQSAAIHK